ncbi:MAG: thiamine-phosphate kinase [Opitutales bacterium]|nr:thiamine-phosphate kinase [Opitutales bacterium]
MNPFTDNPSASIAALGEAGLLERIREWLGPAMPPYPEGMGDDCAILTAHPGNLLTTDSLLYRCHFDDTAPPEAAGAKLLKRNLSDIAAMGGRPTVAVMSAFLPPTTCLRWLEGFVRGLGCCASEHSVRLVGGDLTQTAGDPAFNLTLLGQADRPLPRKGAQPGDHICVTGELGGSLSGHHLTFQPRLEEGRWLARQTGVIACIDITDGLAKDLPALLAEGLAAQLDTACLPASEAVKAIAQDDPNRLLHHVFRDGEDYELLFLFRGDENAKAGLESQWRKCFSTRLTAIGEIITGSNEPAILDKVTRRALLSPTETGYLHFR